MRSSPILMTIAQFSLYLMQLLAVWIFLRGHNLPGGGFIGGLMAAAGIVLIGLAFGRDQAERIFPVPFQVLIGLGLLFATATGVGGILFGRPFLTHAFDYFALPFFGKVELATAVLFDIGVFLVVVGGAKGIILTIATERGREEAGQAARHNQPESES